jgi:methylenetetrahydrofolate dehydrogenase (NADP+) / methenyltetrahydrofolate cyclohydrolase
VPVQLISSQDELQSRLSQMSIVVSATGKADLIEGPWLKPQAVLIDVGAPKPEFRADCYVASRFYTPVPFGVGPVTRYCLLENLFK